MTEVLKMTAPQLDGAKDPNDFRDDPDYLNKIEARINDARRQQWRFVNGNANPPPRCGIFRPREFGEAQKKLPLDPKLVDDSEDGLALLFAEINPHFRWVDRWGKWIEWDGKVWQKDRKLEVFNRTRALVRAVANDKNGRQLRKATTVAAVEKLSRCDERLMATQEQWDQDIYLLNTEGGIVNLIDGSVNPHNPEKYMTKICACSPAGSYPRWLQFLEEVTGDDMELVRFLQRVVGYSLTGSVKEHALFFFYGTGRNGKGTFLNTLEYLLADYAGVAPIEALIESRNERHPTELAGLMGKRLVIAQEPDSGVGWAESKIKTLTGGDPITARYMRQDFFTFEPQFKLLIAGNHKPAFKNLDVALRARLHLIPFTVTIPRERRDPDLSEKLKEEWPGILRWAVDGAVMYHQEGLNPPGAVLNATNEYFEEEDTFLQWVTDKCETGPNCWDTPSNLFNSWKQYAEAGRYEIGTQKDFRQKLINAGYQQRRDRDARKHLGIKAVSEQQPHWQDTH